MKKLPFVLLAIVACAAFTPTASAQVCQIVDVVCYGNPTTQPNVPPTCYLKVVAEVPCPGGGGQAPGPPNHPGPVTEPGGPTGGQPPGGTPPPPPSSETPEPKTEEDPCETTTGESMLASGVGVSLASEDCRTKDTTEQPPGNICRRSGWGLGVRNSFSNPQGGLFATLGAFAGALFPNLGWPSPGQVDLHGVKFDPRGAAGASAGGGLTFFVTSTGRQEDLRGPFNVASVNVGTGPLRLSLQAAWDPENPSIRIFSVGPPVFSQTVGLSGSFYQTSTGVQPFSRRVPEPIEGGPLVLAAQHLRYRVSMTSEEVRDRIRDSVDLERRTWSASGFSGTRDLIGRADTSRFRVRVRKSYQNGFEPFLKGKVERTTGGCMVSATIGPSVMSRVGAASYFALLCVVGAMRIQDVLTFRFGGALLMLVVAGLLFVGVGLRLGRHDAVKLHTLMETLFREKSTDLSSGR